MKARFEDLFDPRRLRESWAKGAPAATAPEPEEARPAARPSAAIEVFEELLRTIKSEVGERGRETLAALAKQARDLIGREFPAEGPAPDEKQLAKIRGELGQALDALEDLVESLEALASR